jgi:ferredoxin-type protein NapG
MARGAALGVIGGGIWGYLLKQQARASPFALRPPGALAEAEFNALCIKCGQCLTACPYDTLKLATLGAPIPIGTPHFVPREVPCYMCPNIPCERACPTGALDHRLGDIDRARMGLAVIDIENCLSWKGLRCEICHRICPLIDKAITVQHHPRQISKHAMFVPVVHSDHCTGCGQCEKACPLEQAAIRILPPELVQGKIGRHYRLGWTVDSPITQHFVPQAPAPAGPPAETAPGMDYLNGGGL